jgi:hypothetical protein
MADDPQTGQDFLHVVGDELSARILEVQRQLGEMAHKCEHTVLESLWSELDSPVPSPLDLGPRRRGIGFRKEGAAWKLFLVEEGVHEREATFDEQEYEYTLTGNSSATRRDEYSRWKELAQCSLMEKSQAIMLLRRLIEGIDTEYKRRVEAVGMALKELDSLQIDPPSNLHSRIVQHARPKKQGKVS